MTDERAIINQTKVSLSQKKLVNYRTQVRRGNKTVKQATTTCQLVEVVIELLLGLGKAWFGNFGLGTRQSDQPWKLECGGGGGGVAINIVRSPIFLQSGYYSGCRDPDNCLGLGLHIYLFWMFFWLSYLK